MSANETISPSKSHFINVNHYQVNQDCHVVDTTLNQC